MNFISKEKLFETKEKIIKQTKLVKTLIENKEISLAEKQEVFIFHEGQYENFRPLILDNNITLNLSDYINAIDELKKHLKSPY